MRFKPNSAEGSFIEFRNPSTCDIRITEDMFSVDIANTGYLLSSPDYANTPCTLSWDIVYLDASNPSIDTTMVDSLYDSLQHRTSLIDFTAGEFLGSSSFLVHTKNIDVLPLATKNRYRVTYNFYLISATYDGALPEPEETEVFISSYSYYQSGVDYLVGLTVDSFDIPDSIGWSYRYRYTDPQVANGCVTGSSFTNWTQWSDNTSTLSAAFEISVGFGFPGLYSACEIQVAPKYAGDTPVATDEECGYLVIT